MRQRSYDCITKSTSPTLYNSTSTPTPEPIFIETHLPGLLSRFSNPGLLAAKLVPTSAPNLIAAYIVWNPPTKAADTRTREERHEDIRKEAEQQGEGINKEIYCKLRLEDEELNEKFFGKGFETRFWVLDALVVDENFQRRGLGTRLVRWGLDELQKRRQEGVEGAYLIASAQGEKTYKGAGFQRVGKRVARSGGEGEGEVSYTHGWFVKRFE